MADKKAVKSFLWGTLTGAVTGAVTALLFAPKPGRELRKDISDTAHLVGEKTADLSRQAGHAVQTLAKRTSELATDAKEAAGRLVSDIRSRANGAPVNDKDTAAAEETFVDDNSAAL